MPGPLAPNVTRAAPPAARRRLAALVGAAVVLGLTLAPLGAPATESLARPSWGCVACGATGASDFVGNVLLFAPLGLLLVRAGTTPRAAALGGALLSAAVELAQAAGIPGRSPALGDLLANTTGAALGAAMAAHGAWLAMPPRRAAGLLAGAGAAAWLSTLAAGAWLLGRDPAPGPRPPRGGILDHTPGFGYYHGRVQRVSVDGWTRPPAPHDGRVTGPAVIGAATGRDVTASALVLGGDGRASLVPIVFVHDAHARAQLLVGQRGADAVLRARLRAARWRLRPPELVLAGALAANREGLAPAATRLDAAVLGDTLWLRVAAPGATRSAAERLTPSTAWLLLPVPRDWGPERHAMTAVWVALTLAPFGYWLGRWARGRALGARAGAAAIAALVAGFGLWALPAALGAAPAPWWEWAGAAAGLAAAAGAAASAERRVAGRGGARQLSPS